MKNRTKIILAVSLILISLFSYSGIDYHLRQQRIAAKEKKTYNEQLAFYADFLKPGMMRVDVERELGRRSVLVESYDVEGGGVTDDFILLERFESPYVYCSFEDATLRLQFDPASSLLRKTSVYHQLKDCL